MKLVEDMRQAWKLWSIKLAAVVAVVTTIIAANQSIALGLIYFLPEGNLRIVASIGIGLVVFVIPTIIRLAKQPKKEVPDGEQS